MYNGFKANNHINQEGGQDDFLKRLIEMLRDTGYTSLDALLQRILGPTPPGNNQIGGGGGTIIGGGGGGGGNCLTGDVPVRMADGSEKAAKDIKVHDHVMGFDPGIGQVPQEVFTVTSASQACVLVEFDGGAIEASTTHNWFVIEGERRVIKPTLTLKAGMVLVGEDGNEKVITALTPTRPQVVYWWNCLPNQCYYAGGVLHHNASDPSGYILPAYVDPYQPYTGPVMGKESTGGTQTGGSN